MAAAIRIRLADLLRILTETPPVKHRSARPNIQADLEAIREYLQSGPARRSDLETELGVSGDAVLHRLGMLKAAGEVVYLPDHRYQLAGVV